MKSHADIRYMYFNCEDDCFNRKSSQPESIFLSRRDGHKGHWPNKIESIFSNDQDTLREYRVSLQ